MKSKDVSISPVKESSSYYRTSFSSPKVLEETTNCSVFIPPAIFIIAWVVLLTLCLAF